MQSPFGGWRHHLARWEACHWIRGSRGSSMNPVPLPPPQFGGAAKGKRLNGQARRLTSPDLHILCRMCTVDNKAPRSNPFISSTTISTGCSAPACGGSPAKRARGKPLLERSEVGLFSIAHQGGCQGFNKYIMALKAPYLASAAILYNSRGRKPGARPGGVSRSRTEPLAPRAKGPAAPSTLARERPRSAD